MEVIQKAVESCVKCGLQYGNSSIGFGKIDKPLIFFIGTNPWVENHKFKDGRGITILKKKLAEWKFDDFFMDNIVKCQMPHGGQKPDVWHAEHCIQYLNDQIEKIKPRFIICFGYYASMYFIGGYASWMEYDSYMSIPVYTIPHFSSILYKGERERIDYYKRLKGLIKELKNEL